MDDRKPAAPNTPRSTSNEAAAEKQREIQREQDRKEPSQGSGGQDKGPPQTAKRQYPSDVPSQHLAKPGQEADMALKPQFMAPDCRGSGKLDGVAALLPGGDS